MKNPNELLPKVDEAIRRDIQQSHNYDVSKASSIQFSNRGKFDTPQWSTESQVSQESSDDILQTSESDKSHKMSQNSTISQSPLSGQNFVLSEELTSKNEGFENITNYQNREIITNVKQEILPKISSVLSPRTTQLPPILPPLPISTSDEARNNYKSGSVPLTTANRLKTSNIYYSIDQFPIEFHSQLGNLETLPDNSEQPDAPTQTFSKVSYFYSTYSS